MLEYNKVRGEIKYVGLEFTIGEVFESKFTRIKIVNKNVAHLGVDYAGSLSIQTPTYVIEQKGDIIITNVTHYQYFDIWVDIIEFTHNGVSYYSKIDSDFFGGYIRSTSSDKSFYCTDFLKVDGVYLIPDKSATQASKKEISEVHKDHKKREEMSHYKGRLYSLCYSLEANGVKKFGKLSFSNQNTGKYFFYLNEKLIFRVEPEIYEEYCYVDDYYMKWMKEIVHKGEAHLKMLYKKRQKLLEAEQLRRKKEQDDLVKISEEYFKM